MESTSAALISCFNNTGAVGKVVHGALEFVERVIIIDDGSTDGSGDIAKSAGALVKFNFRRKLNFKRCGGQHKPAEIIKCIEVARKEKSQ